MNQSNDDILDNVTIEDLIPQKVPFVMVDKLIQYSDDKIIAGLTIQRNNIFIKNTIFTEPGLIEHMAQTIALHTGYQYFLKNLPAPTGYIGSIKKVEIKKLPKLGDEIKTTVSILHEIMEVTLVNISVELNNEEIACGEMKTVLAK
ncbi:MAG: hypothetical protein L3J20_01475 [Flavobacteriaceae bacterium]|nr:hypothetical protein [Flavobacteriaceae bacterium]